MTDFLSVIPLATEASLPIDLHLVTLAAIILNREGVLALVVTRATGLAGLHVAHGGFQDASLEGENPGVAIGAFVCLGMELMAESGLAGGCFKRDVSGFHPFVTLAAITGRRKGILAVVTGAA